MPMSQTTPENDTEMAANHYVGLSPHYMEVHIAQLWLLYLEPQASLNQHIYFNIEVNMN